MTSQEEQYRSLRKLLGIDADTWPFPVPNARQDVSQCGSVYSSIYYGENVGYGR